MQEGNPDDIDTNRLFVGNLHYRVAWQDLKSHFRSVGDVRYADVLRSGRDQRSKGCGIVEMESVEDAKRAVEELHGSELFGRPIFIRADRPRGSKQRGPPPAAREDVYEDNSGVPMASGGDDYVSDGENSGNGGGEVDFQPDFEHLTNRLFVGNLSYGVAWQDLKDLFATIGPVAYADVMRMHDGRSKGCGIVEFVNADDARLAIERLQDASLRGRNIFIREDREDYAYSGPKKRSHF